MKNISLSLSSDIKRTQWEDPRLQNVAITGPVSIFVFLWGCSLTYLFKDK